MDLDEYDEVAVRAALAALYGLPAARLSLSVRSGSLLVTVSIDKRSADADDLMTRLLSVGDATLSSQLGVAVSASPPTERNQTRVEAQSCDAGSWCTAGITVPCGEDGCA